LHIARWEPIVKAPMYHTDLRANSGRRIVIVAIAAALSLSHLGGARAGASEEAGLAQTRAEKARKQAELDAARATDEQLEARLAQLKSEISSQSEKARQAKDAAAAATEALKLAQERLDRTAAELESQRSIFASRVRAAYKSPDTGLLDALVSSASISEAGVRLYGISRLVENDNEIVARLRDLRSDLEEDRQFFEAEKARADAARREAEEQAARLAEVHASTEATEKALSERIEELKQEVEALAREEARIQSIIRARQAAAEAALKKRSQSSQGSSGSASQPSAKGFIWPVRGTVTSGFGMRWGRLHAGIDIAAPMGTPVRAAQSGQVIFAGTQGGYGNLVLIAHGDGIVTAYAHLSSIGVGVNQFVDRGQIIGAVGSTGHSTGPHLHFEVRVNGRPVDPMAYL
jgi:murein DD-endopeptidase MepM/ murein hydrolase activator NlpD